MKFYGTPHELVRISFKKPFEVERYSKSIGRFDENGVFETEEPRVIQRMKRFFKYEDSDIIEKTVRKCKKCDFTCNSQGELLAHYRTEHPKGSDG